jgi:hypothetical protein
VDVRIGVLHTPKEIDIEMGDDVDRDKLIESIEESMTSGTVLWLTDRKGRRVGVPIERVAYIEIGEPAADHRRVGFGAP